MCYRVDVHVVRAAAAGHWDYVFHSLAPVLNDAAERAGHHVPCPIHGGKDGFRLFPNFAENGSGICNTCGQKRDGFALLSWVNGWSFRETLENVARVIGLEPSSRFELLDEERCSRSCVLSVLKWEDNPNKGFVLTYRDEKTGQENTLRSRTLKEPFMNADLHPGDRANLTVLSRRRMRDSVTGREFYRLVWSAEKLPTLQEERRQAKARHDLDQQLAQAIDSHWRAGLPIAQVPAVGKYLAHRGLSGIAPERLVDLRAQAKRSYRDGSSSLVCPAMLAAVRDVRGKLIALHSTLLTEDGWKANTAAPKRLSKLPSDRTIAGSAIHFGEPTQVLAVAEGIETALSVAKATKMPCWACISANGLASLEVPQGVNRVLIFADRDKSGTGQKAAQNLQERLLREGIECVVLLPEGNIPQDAKGIDWNDVLMQGKAFPCIGQQ